MAAQNYVIVPTDTGDSGTGPYTATMFQTPTTTPTTTLIGGTQITISLPTGTFPPSTGPYGVLDMLQLYGRRIANNNAGIWDIDPLN